MNEIQLSIDLNQIEFEINYHKNVAGQSIWEIGSRLNHVKQNDLTHGEFETWLDKIKISHTQARRFMKIAKDLKEPTSVDLGINALYLISTLPEEHKQVELEKATKGDPSTVKELRELNKRLKEQEAAHQRQLLEKDQVIERSYNQIKQLQQQEPKIVEREVLPDDYKDLKSTKAKLEQQVVTMQENIHQLKQDRDSLKEIEAKSQKYDQLTEAIQEAQGKIDAHQKDIAAYKNIAGMLREMNGFLDKAAGLIYVEDIQTLRQDALLQDKVMNLLARVDNWSSDLRKKIERGLILEGEFTDE